MELHASLEAILFHQGVPLSRKRLRELLKCDAAALDTAIGQLEGRLLSGGLRLLKKDDELLLGTAPDASALIEAITKEELSRDLSKAALETLSVVLYKGPITRGEIDHIRGVNSTFILRNLLVRGLVEKIENPKDQRSFLYRPSFALLQTLGITDITAMPGYDEVAARLAAFEVEHEKEAAQDHKDPSTTAASTDESAGAATESSAETSDDREEELEADQAEEDEVGEGYLDPELHDALTDEMDTDDSGEEGDLAAPDGDPDRRDTL
ncbi:MAG TPA: SMC-Scp complex subunit ScpB [Candidatus Paceibacterota bacterium]|nr:SMC-Scp complex subunit ScpB [Candidatus Paceibacterota bacterium]